MNLNMPPEGDLLPLPKMHKQIARLQANLLQAATKGAVRIKQRKGTHRGVTSSNIYNHNARAISSEPSSSGT